MGSQDDSSPSTENDSPLDHTSPDDSINDIITRSPSTVADNEERRSPSIVQLSSELSPIAGSSQSHTAQKGGHASMASRVHPIHSNSIDDPGESNKEMADQDVGEAWQSERPDTPYTRSSSLGSIDPDIIALLGSDPNEDLREMRQAQKRIEREYAARREAEKRDEELARCMEEDYRQATGRSTEPYLGYPSVSAATADSSASASFRAASTLPRSTSQTFLNSTGHFQRPLPLPRMQVKLPQIKNEGDSGGSSIPRPNVPIRSIPQVIDLSGDSDEDTSIFAGMTGNSHASGNMTALASQDNPFRSIALGDVRARHYPNHPNPSQPELQYLRNPFSVVPPDQGVIRRSGFLDTLQWGLSYIGDQFEDFGGNTVDEPYDLDRGSYGAYMPGSSEQPFSLDDHSDYVYPSRHVYDYDHYVKVDPDVTRKELQTLLETVRPESDIPTKEEIQTPSEFTKESTLYPHQLLGLQWLQNMEASTNQGGILADDMGLGKTLQTLALIVTRPSEDRRCKTTLIVAPVALLRQWEREIKTRLKPTSRLKTYIYHGSGIKTTWEQLKLYDIVLTSYGTLASELKRKQDIHTKRTANPNWHPSKVDELPLLGDASHWYRVVLDEAQCIKNRNTKSALAAYALQAKSRFCVTGTPMMNGVEELFSLIHFLRIKPYCSLEKFNAAFSKPLKGTSESGRNNAMSKLRVLLKVILLRRTKKSIIDGKPILDLPERITNITHAVFSTDEKDFYDALEGKIQLRFNRYLKAGTVSKNYAHILVLLLRLRQACCHPHLIRDHAEPAVTLADGSNVVTNVQLLTPEAVARIKADNSEALDCPACWDVAENATIFTPCGHHSCLPCCERLLDAAIALHGADGRWFKCPNCRGEVKKDALTDHTSFKQIHMPEATEDILDGILPEEAAETTDDSTTDDSSDDDSDEGSSLDGFIIDDDDENQVKDESDSEAEGYGKGDNPFERSTKRKRSHKTKKSRSSSTQASSSRKKSKNGKGKGKEVTKPKKEMTLIELRKESGKNAKAKKKYLKKLRKEYQTSAKIDKTMEILQAVRDQEEGEKTIIFSQFTSLLDLLEVPISNKEWGYRRYDGSMTVIARNNAVMEFTDNPDIRILLVSLKAGSSGLNLTSASNVVLFDPFWNPYIEEQAIDRAHRIGQRRTVQVHRILVAGTVEDRIVDLQERKRSLIEGALDEGASQSLGRLSVRELAGLLGVSA
ncbi:hypothetical protein MMC25_003121 [Agyrium rufum]|nr:hypothetical protein [Agyrium rufum]